MNHSQLSPRQAAEALGVSESTIRRWCDGGLLPVSRTRGKHRRIARAALLDFARREGLAITDESPIVAAGHGGRMAPTDKLATRLFHKLAEGDELAAHQLIVDLVTRTMEPCEVCDRVIAPAMHRIGAAWADGQLDIYHERWATQAVQGALSTARAMLPVPAPGAPVVTCAALSGDPYTLGPIMIALVVQSLGFAPRLLGADIPLDEVYQASRKSSATMAAISVSIVPDQDRFVAEFNRFALETERLGIRVAAGGRALTREVRVLLSADFFGDTVTHLHDYARRHFCTPLSQQTGS